MHRAKNRQLQYVFTFIQGAVNSVQSSCKTRRQEQSPEPGSNQGPKLCETLASEPQAERHEATLSHHQGEPHKMILSNDNCNLKLMQGAMHKTIEIEFHPSNNNTLITLAERVSLKMSQGTAHRNSKNSILINITLFPAKEFLLLMQYCIFSNNNKKESY